MKLIKEVSLQYFEPTTEKCKVIEKDTEKTRS